MSSNNTDKATPLPPQSEDDQDQQVSPSKPTPKDDAKQSENPKEASKLKAISIFKLFRYAKRWDLFFVIFGIVFTMVSGCAEPVMVFLVGDLTNEFAPESINDSLTDRVMTQFISLMVAGGIATLCFFFAKLFLKLSSFSQSKILRVRYLKAILSQEMGWHDKSQMSEISSTAETDCAKVQAFLESKLELSFQALAFVVAGFLIGYVRGWRMALVSTATMPLVSISFLFIIKSFTEEIVLKIAQHARASAMVTQALGSIKTVVGLNCEEKEVGRYSKILVDIRQKMKKAYIKTGLAFGFGDCFNLVSHAISCYVGALFVLDGVTNAFTGEVYTSGDVFTIFISILMGASSLTMLGTVLKEVYMAKVTGNKLFNVIDRNSAINIYEEKGEKPDQFESKIEFENVHFNYPSKAEVKVLKGINLVFEKGQRTALVGESGCGKSTCMQLIERFYDPDQGRITLSGKDLKDLNLKWLRKNIAYVGQEPVLFSTSIKENLQFAKADASDEEIKQALKKANAYDFVSKLEKGLQTYVGEGGTQLSGGQKQRIAIARAILKNASILLLDEATSALDRKNEREIQETLDEISKEKTTIVIAHRLTTIQNADKIYVFDKGNVVECGKHAELVEKKGKYYDLQHAQLTEEEKEKKSEDSPEKDDQLKLRDVKLDGIKSNKTSDKMKSEKKANEEEKSEQKKKKVVEFFKTYKKIYNTYGKKKRCMIFWGYIGSFGVGIVKPLSSVLLAYYLVALLDPEGKDLEDTSKILSGLFGVLSVYTILATFLQKYCFGMIGEDVSKEMKEDVFRKFLNMHMSWHDNSENMSGKLSTAISKDTEALANILSNAVGYLLHGISSILTGIIIGLVASWKLTLIAIGLLPLIVIAFKLMAHFDNKRSVEAEGYNNANKYVIESISNYRTIASLTAEEIFVSKYEAELESLRKIGRKFGAIQGLTSGFTELTIFIFIAVFNLVGAYLVEDGSIEPLNMFVVFYGTIFGAIEAGKALKFVSDINKGLSAADVLFKYLEQKSLIDTQADAGSDKKRTEIRGKIEFKNVKFKYPTRDQAIFKGLSFSCEPGQKIALVGSSGCGKSTIIQLLMRFYDVDDGEILVDGINIKDYDVGYLRRNIGIVSQEPTLFDGTIRFNIKYAKEDASDEEMTKAAEQANCRKFIENNEFVNATLTEEEKKKLGAGYDREVGAKGGQLSGGQKQRVAIARAIIKSPKFYLFDEATSALDTESEKLVQDALNEVSKGLTTITVAHRINTIKNSDLILVFDKGGICESGTYDELKEKEGYFYHLERGLN